MKKVLVILAAMFLVFSVVGNAAADFTYGPQSSLGLSVYNPSTNVETGYDLGIIGNGLDLDYHGYLTTIDVSDTDATVALYSATQAWDFYVGLTNDGTAPALGGGATQFQSAVSGIYSIGYQGAASPVTVSASDPKTANSLFQDFGNYLGVVQGGNPLWQPSLAPLASGDIVEIFLYEYNGVTLNTGFDPATDYAATLYINGAGDVYLNAVPVPGALVLICTGLLGALGIKRRKA